MKVLARSLIALFVGATFIAAAKNSPQSEEQGIRMVLERYYKALSNADSLRVASFYWPQATISSLWPATDGGEQEVMISSVRQFTDWYTEEARNYDYMRYRILRCELRVYQDLADAWVVDEVREKKKEGAEEILRSVNVYHLLRHKGEWKIAGHAWLMEATNAPLSPPTSKRGSPDG